jgi:hypothetical protein
MNTRECDESAIIDSEIGKEMSKMKCESNEVNHHTGYFDLSFCEFGQEFDCFQISMFKYIDVILSIEYIFVNVYTLWSLLSLILEWNVQLP